ncbi:MAG: hypothetical protein ACYTGW_11715 [Planctomycetota bacterium]
MSAPGRLDELLADRAIWGLSAAEQAELDRTLAERGEDLPDPGFEHTAAAITAASLFGKRVSAPPHVLRRIEATAVGYFVGTQDIPPAHAAQVLQRS